MKKWMTVVSTCLLLVLLGGTAQAFGVESTTESNVAVNGIEEEYVKEDRYVDEQGGLVETTEISTRASDKVLWDRHYNGEYSVKKDIYVRNPDINGSAGKVNVYIKNTGNKSINVRIYSSNWNPTVIYATAISPGQNRVFTIGQEYGHLGGCHGGSCFAYHDFRVSVYPDSGKMSFYGRAKVYY